LSALEEYKIYSCFLNKRTPYENKHIRRNA
jgi:hypothetical protein